MPDSAKCCKAREMLMHRHIAAKGRRHANRDLRSCVAMLRHASVDLRAADPTLAPVRKSRLLGKSMAENAASQGARPRPLSPHLQIYRWPATMATSIVHRATGVALTAGMAFLAWWLMALATGPDAYGLFTSLAFTPLGQLVILGFVWSLSFHLLNGIRHLTWDIGHGFASKTANRISILIILGSIVLAAGVFLVGYLILHGDAL